MMRRAPESVDFLILGAGWTSTFLIPLLEKSSISFAATTTTGHDDTIPFKFDPESEDPTPYQTLPGAHTVLITFPLVGRGQSLLLTRLYHTTHESSQPRWIQLGTSSIFSAPHWNNASSPYDESNSRAIAEDELREHVQGVALNLAGLYGGSRNPRDWLTRVANSKQDVQKKQAVHLVHGEDVARAIVAVHENFTPGKRWLLTDLRVYDWWNLFLTWGREASEKAQKTLGPNAAQSLEYQRWVLELMEEEGIRGLPRNTDSLGRVLDSRDFWSTMKIWPSRSVLS